VFEVVELAVKFVVVLFILTEFEEFGLKLGDDEVLLVRLDLGRVVILGEVSLGEGEAVPSCMNS
jgi:hypothetical protein